MLEVDCTMLTPEPVLKTSGHVDKVRLNKQRIEAQIYGDLTISVRGLDVQRPEEW
jgi:hypothetical protein